MGARGSGVKEIRRFSMPELGYSLSSEEFSASDLVRFAPRSVAGIRD